MYHAALDFFIHDSVFDEYFLVLGKSSIFYGIVICFLRKRFLRECVKEKQFMKMADTIPVFFDDLRNMGIRIF